jgi:hypothetical protein
VDNIPAVAGNQPLVTSAEFIRLTIYNDATDPTDTTIYTFSSAYQFETIDSQVYSPLGGLLAVGVQQRDLSVTSASTSVSLSGIGSDNIFMVLEKKIKGSKLEITRGFYDDNMVLTSTAKRYTGIITSYNITEERVDQNDNFTVTVNASSYKLVLQNKTSGRRTNPNSWNQPAPYGFPLDTSMTWISSISGRTFDFGMTPTAKTVPASSGTATNSTTSTQVDYTGSGA